jgi:hypothetical protein
MFMEVDHGQNTQSYWNAVALVPFGDAPVGYALATFLPLISKASLVAALATLVLRRNQ